MPKQKRDELKFDGIDDRIPSSPRIGGEGMSIFVNRIGSLVTIDAVALEKKLSNTKIL